MCMDIGCTEDSCAIARITGLPVYATCPLCGAKEYSEISDEVVLFEFPDPLPSQSFLKGVTMVIAAAICIEGAQNMSVHISLNDETIHTIYAEEDEFCGCNECRLEVVTDQQNHSVGNYWANYNYGGQNVISISVDAFPVDAYFYSAPSLIFLHYDSNLFWE